MKKNGIFCILLLLSAFAVLAQPSSKAVHKALSPFVEQRQIGGVVAVVADRDKIISMDCLGYADIENNRKMSGESLFWIASQSKPICATALMMLVDEGKVDLDAPVTDYLPELKPLMVRRIKRDGWQVEERPSRPVTLRHLLSHTSGMDWIAGVQAQMGKIDVLPFCLSLRVSAMTPLLFEPGERYSYSNQGINIAATVIERITGISYPEFLQKRLFDPLRMTSATFWPEGKQLEKLVVPYRMSPAGELEPIEIDQLQYPLDDRTHRFAEAGGGLFCTPADLIKFYRMILNGGTLDGKRYVSRQAIDEMGKRQTPKGVPDDYGLGWWVSDTAMGHGGAYGTDTKIYRKNGYVVQFYVLGAGLPKQGDAMRAFEAAVKGLYELE